jgi:hypothetical protein
MPRPTVAQLACGWATVISSATAMILLSQARSVPAILAICLTALALGLLVAITAPAPRARRARAARAAAAEPVAAAPVTARVPRPAAVRADTRSPVTANES